MVSRYVLISFPYPSWKNSFVSDHREKSEKIRSSFKYVIFKSATLSWIDIYTKKATL